VNDSLFNQWWIVGRTHHPPTLVARVIARPAIDGSDRNTERIELVIKGVLLWLLAAEHALE